MNHLYRLIGVIICLLLLASCRLGRQEKAEPSPAPSPSPTARGGEVIVTAQPGATASPLYTPTASPTEDLSGQVINCSGQLRSETGTALNLIADWNCVSVNAHNVKLTITLSLESYSLSVGERLSNRLVLNGETITFHTSELEIPGGGLSTTPLYVWSETLPLDASGSLRLPISAVWEFSGSYSGVELDVLELSGQISAP